MRLHWPLQPDQRLRLRDSYIDIPRIRSQEAIDNWEEETVTGSFRAVNQKPT